jgi:hypothetical protein
LTGFTGWTGFIFPFASFKTFVFRRKALALNQALHHPLAWLVRATKDTEFEKIDEDIIVQRIAKRAIGKSFLEQ